MPVPRAFETPPSVMFSPPCECAKLIRWVHMCESLCVCVCVYKTLGGGATAVTTAVLQSPMMHLGISHSCYDFYLPVLYPLLSSKSCCVTPHTVPLQMKEDVCCHTVSLYNLDTEMVNMTCFGEILQNICSYKNLKMYVMLTFQLMLKNHLVQEYILKYYISIL